MLLFRRFGFSTKVGRIYGDGNWMWEGVFQPTKTPGFSLVSGSESLGLSLPADSGRPTDGDSILFKSNHLLASLNLLEETSTPTELHQPVGIGQCRYPS
jgi:hypothetical protein